MQYVDADTADESFEWLNRFAYSGSRLISRVPVGRFFEEEINNERSVFINMYKSADGYILWNEWDFSWDYADTPEQVRVLIELMQDAWVELASLFSA